MSTSPMLATRAERVPTGPEWVHEVKWDGMRVLADIRDGRLTLTSRLGNDVTLAYPELAPLADQYEDLLLDAEIVVLEDGRPSFGALAERMHVRSPRKALALSATRPVTLMVFDLLRLFGSDLTAQPWRARRELLERLELHAARWRVPPTYDDGQGLLAATAEQGLEGVVSKRRDSPYTAGRRSADWLKIPHRTLVSAVVGGWRPEAGSAAVGGTAAGRLGAVLVGLPTTTGLHFIGRVGSGLAGRAGAAVLAELRELSSDRDPFVDLPREDALGARWVRPQLVVDVRSLGESSGGRLRQPSFIGMRPDLRPADVLEVGDA